MTPGEEQPIAAAFRTWLLNRGHAERTARDYARTAGRLVAAGIHPETVTEATFLQWFHDQRIRTDTTRHRYAYAYRAFFDFLISKGARKTNPANAIQLQPLSRRRREPIEDVADRLQALRSLDKRAYNAALFIMHTRLKLSDALSISERIPVPESVTVGVGRNRRRVRLEPVARSLLEELEGSVGWADRTLQRRFTKVGITAEELRLTPPTLAVWLLTPESAPPLGVPEFAGTSIEAYRDESWTCLLYGNLRGAIVLARSTIQLCTRRYLTAPPGRWYGGLQQDLDALAPSLGRGWTQLADRVRHLGNEWAHPDPRDPLPPPSRATVEDRLNTMDTVLKYMVEVERAGGIVAVNKGGRPPQSP
jgi:hypothetical protein